MNIADKASLYQLSLAFLRRFAVIDVPLPDRAAYRGLLVEDLAGLEDETRERLADLAEQIAFGPIELGPAIMLDVTTFTRRGLIATSTGTAPYSDVDSAFLTALRLYAIPQYEGADRAKTESLTSLLREALPDPPQEAWAAFVQAVARLVAG